MFDVMRLVKMHIIEQLKLCMPTIKLRNVTHLEIDNSEIIFNNLVFPNLKYLKITNQSKKNIALNFPSTYQSKPFDRLEYASIQCNYGKLSESRLTHIKNVCEKATTLMITSKVEENKNNDVERVFPGATIINKKLKANFENKTGDLLIEYNRNENIEELILFRYLDNLKK
eukprot:403367536